MVEFRFLVGDDEGAVRGRLEGGGGKGEVVLNALDCGEECFGCS